MPHLPPPLPVRPKGTPAGPLARDWLRDAVTCPHCGGLGFVRSGFWDLVILFWKGTRPTCYVCKGVGLIHKAPPPPPPPPRTCCTCCRR